MIWGLLFIKLFLRSFLWGEFLCFDKKLSHGKSISDSDKKGSWPKYKAEMDDKWLFGREYRLKMCLIAWYDKRILLVLIIIRNSLDDSK